MGEKSRGLWAYTPQKQEGPTLFGKPLRTIANAYVCEACDGLTWPGDWPFCGGDNARHRRD